MVMDGPLLEAAGERFGERPLSAVHGVQRVDSRPKVDGADVMAFGPSLPGAECGYALATVLDGVVDGVEQIGGVAVAQIVARRRVGGPAPGGTARSTVRSAAGSVRGRRRHVSAGVRRRPARLGDGDGLDAAPPRRGVARRRGVCGRRRRGRRRSRGRRGRVRSPRRRLRARGRPRRCRRAAVDVALPGRGSLFGDGEVVVSVLNQRREPVRDRRIVQRAGTGCAG